MSKYIDSEYLSASVTRRYTKGIRYLETMCTDEGDELIHPHILNLVSSSDCGSFPCCLGSHLGPCDPLKLEAQTRAFQASNHINSIQLERLPNLTASDRFIDIRISPLSSP